MQTKDKNTFLGFQISSDKYASNKSHSVLRYQPSDDGDFGLIYCWATNVMGTMDTPCAFQLIPAGKNLIKLKIIK